LTQSLSLSHAADALGAGATEDAGGVAPLDSADGRAHPTTKTSNAIA
jgi:hypothetical protein